MSERKRLFLLICIMVTACLSVGGIAIFLLYRTAFEEERVRLVETAQSQARLIEAVARFDSLYSRDYPEGPEQATLSQIIDAHSEYKGFGKTGEFTLARRKEDKIVFLLRHRHAGLQNPKPILFSSQLAEPMRQALLGLSGTVVGLDYRGKKVLAAHEPVRELNLGIVAKIDMAEVQKPFIRSGLLGLGVAMLVVLAGAGLFVRIGNPIIRELEDRSANLTTANEKMKREINERKAAVAALRISEERYRDLYENAPNGYFSVSSTDGSVLECNSTALQLLGYDRRTIAGLKVFDLYADTPDNKSNVERVFKHFKAGKDVRDIELQMRRKTGESVWISLSVKPVKDRDGNVTESRSMVMDISERKRTEEALRDSENRFRALTVLAPVGIYLTDKNGRYQYVNERWLKMSGMSYEEAWGDGWVKGLHPDDRDLVLRAWEKMVESEGEWGLEYRFQTPQGKTTFVLVLGLASPMRDDDGQITGYIGANADITYLKETERQLMVSLNEKDVLLKEVHHRVKNNIQIVSGLLNISSMKTSNQEAKDVLQDARSKVFSMALIHSQLYQQEQLDAIDMGTYTHRLMGQLSNAYNDRGRSIRTVVEPSDVYLTLNQAIPCSLVINELVSNALKHAFTERQKGTVAVSVSGIDDNMVTIKVKDDGIGIPEGTAIDKPKTMGLELVKGLVNQLGGTVQFRQDKGTEVTVKFKSVKEEKQYA
ncbi:MAG: PAS domain S-box protein [Deltaproteobacteria bacterium]|nr:PAS domain S-box protein [Deltaproteobacteria bacterium]